MSSHPFRLIIPGAPNRLNFSIFKYLQSENILAVLHLKIPVNISRSKHPRSDPEAKSSLRQAWSRTLPIWQSGCVDERRRAGVSPRVNFRLSFAGRIGPKVVFLAQERFLRFVGSFIDLFERRGHEPCISRFRTKLGGSSLRPHRRDNSSTSSATLPRRWCTDTSATTEGTLAGLWSLSQGDSRLRARKREIYYDSCGSIQRCRSNQWLRRNKRQ